ncbi:4-hydroxyphenylpyruvate dioxygenase [Phormidesmis sp. 146-12]
MLAFMKIDHIHFYVNDAIASRNWFVDKMGFQAIEQNQNHDTQTETIVNGAVKFLLSSPLAASSPVKRFLQQHPPGVVDVAFCVQDLEAVIERAIALGTPVLQPIRLDAQARVKSAQIAAWGTLKHTLIERTASSSPSLLDSSRFTPHASHLTPHTSHLTQFTEIDHVVLNVASGDLGKAVRWYEAVLGFQPQQMFAIKTDRSGLCSRVMQYPDSSVKLPINEPTSESSQIQEFLDLNRGAGIQHIALHTENIVEAIARFRQTGLSFLQVPDCYYTQLQQRPSYRLSESQLMEIRAQQLLVDWQTDRPEGVLIQTFTQPIFECPTFFFELIERRTYALDDRLLQAQGFGEGNFRALFEAIEREQLRRGSLKG